MLPIIDRYILREVAKAFFAIVTVLLLIVMTNSFVKILQEAAGGALGQDVLIEMLGLEVLQVLGPIVPPAFFFAILFTLGRMYCDSEMTAMSASGVSAIRIFRSFIIAALPISLLVAWLTLDLLPWVNFSKEQIRQAQDDASKELAASVAGRFNESSKGDLIFYAEEMSDDRSRLRNVFIQNRQHGRAGLITATEGYQYIDPDTGDDFLVLTRGIRYEGEPGSADYSIGEFDKYAFRLGSNDDENEPLPFKAMPTRELMGSKNIRKRAEFEYRLMFPFAVIVFTLLSIPLSKSLPWEGVYGRLVLAILFYFIFLNLQAVSENWMVSGTTAAWMGRWWVHPFMLFLGLLVVIYKSPRSLLRLLRRSAK
ncbi:LPS export ABC transporter permease LptF [Solemya velesiana gill symbiont]|uniref:Lipopolysaccharide export system permease protein LptF n=1 Tax=Solemya velesiana gill symbiont TaxID=1918948 RepID=A0A1T2KVF1_9GAMM|nr:LPS export ABC transporter permease LptF [Solemya velesiana gill symbiont]OOZ36804.1 LPS export ABC transporter permease LptF [Solemya velesiana gill symbiont]